MRTIETKTLRELAELRLHHVRHGWAVVGSDTTYADDGRTVVFRFVELMRGGERMLIQWRR